MSRPLVSIVMPAYNSAGFIGETISSALAQTFGDFELLIVDDGSTDGTIDAIHKTAGGDPRVTVMASTHGGPAAARNVALDAVRGRFIALLDSDDAWMPAYLDEQLAWLEQFPDRAIVTSNAFNRGGSLDGRPLWTRTEGHRLLTARDLILEENCICIMSVFRREVIDRIGGFDPGFTGNEDYEFWLRAADAGFGIVQSWRPLGYYRRREDSVSSNEIRMLKGIQRVLQSAERMHGAVGRERVAIDRQLRRFRHDLLKAEVRDAVLAVASRLGPAWPDRLQRAYALRRTHKAS